VKVIILAGGLGTRIMEETHDKPKPMVEIAGKPILLHIMDIYNKFIDCEFKIAAGYKIEVIQKFIKSVKYDVEVIDTGELTGTAGRIKKIMDIYPMDSFMATYGDGLADINITMLLDFHNSHNKLATVTAVRPAARFGKLKIVDGVVVDFAEKSQSDEGWINGGFFVFKPDVKNYILDEMDMFEHSPLRNLSTDGQLMAYSHEKFWQPMDTLRERNDLETLVRNKKAPWLDI
jgi:glucose-1-phosphate cytidylyltransferase